MDILLYCPKSIFGDYRALNGLPGVKFLVPYRFLTFRFPIFLPFSRYQDENTQAFFMVVSSNRWLSVRLDLLSGVFVTIVAVAAILVTESAGE